MENRSFQSTTESNKQQKKKELLEQNRSLQNIFIYLPFWYQDQFFLLDFSKKKKLAPPTAFLKPTSYFLEWKKACECKFLPAMYNLCSIMNFTIYRQMIDCILIFLRLYAFLLNKTLNRSFKKFQMNTSANEVQKP